MTKTFLFIGGPKDGCRIPIAADMVGHPIRFDKPILEPGASIREAMPIPLDAKFEIVTYLPMKLAGNKTAILVYAIEGMDGDGVMGQLVIGYREIP